MLAKLYDYETGIAVYVDPEHVRCIEKVGDYCRVQVQGGEPFSTCVNGTPEEVEAILAQSRRLKLTAIASDDRLYTIYVAPGKVKVVGMVDGECRVKIGDDGQPVDETLSEVLAMLGWAE